MKCHFNWLTTHKCVDLTSLDRNFQVRKRIDRWPFWWTSSVNVRISLETRHNSENCQWWYRPDISQQHDSINDIYTTFHCIHHLITANLPFSCHLLIKSITTRAAFIMATERDMTAEVNIISNLMASNFIASLHSFFFSFSFVFTPVFAVVMSIVKNTII